MWPTVVVYEYEDLDRRQQGGLDCADVTVRMSRWPNARLASVHGFQGV
jgi:hypothetical protein